MKTKALPALITLSAAAISCISSFMMHVGLAIFIRRLFITVLIFFCISIPLTWFVDYAMQKFAPPPEEEEALDESEPIEGEDLVSGELENVSSSDDEDEEE